jgi:XTP/dITP diphosphohydrolase
MCRKLLTELAGVPRERRRARFVCAVAAAQPTGILWTLQATCAGYVAEEMRGTEGFGYDPIFFYPPLRRTFAELTPPVKNAVSHRGRAFRRARAKLARELTRGGSGDGDTRRTQP